MNVSDKTLKLSRKSIFSGAKLKASESGDAPRGFGQGGTSGAVAQERVFADAGKGIRGQWGESEKAIVEKVAKR